MNVEYQDGHTEQFLNQTPEQVEAMTKRVTDPEGDVASVKVWRAPQYPDNRAGRRKWAHDLKRKKAHCG